MATESTPALSWVDRLKMVPSSGASSSATKEFFNTIGGVGGVDNNIANKALEFNIASLNVLAESYLTPRSHPGLPESYASVAFTPIKRRQLLLDTLERFCSPPSTTTTANFNEIVEKYIKWDILALQELDLVQSDDNILPGLESWGYQVVRTPSDDRRDCSAIAFDTKKFTLVEYEVVKFDDLATLLHNNNTNENGENSATTLTEGYNNIRPGKKKPNSVSELTGMVRSFLRRNCAVVAHLKSVENGESLIVASVHLYWHPGYEYVKLCQAKYLMDRVTAFASNTSKNTDTPAAVTIGSGKTDSRIPTIICGDMNSKPNSIVHKFFVDSSVDARIVAPWRYFWDRDTEEMYSEDLDINSNNQSEGDRKDGQDPTVSDESDSGPEKDGDSSENGTSDFGYVMKGLPAEFTMFCGTIDSSDNTTNISDKGSNKESVGPDSAQANDVTDNNADGLSATLAWRRVNKHSTPQDYQHSTPPPPVKYMLDYTLNKFTRWLRILGIDATLETLEEENERTSGGKIALFDHCKNDKRTLLTTSYKLLLRKDCPPGAYLLDPKSSSDLEKALPRLLRTHGIELSPCKFLTRCVICNGSIKRVTSDEEKKSVFVDHGAPKLVDSKEDMEVFRCDTCGQGYWWDDRSSSSASRVFAQATKLLQLCIRGGVSIKDEAITDEKKRKVIMGAFDFVDVAKERESEGLDDSNSELSVIEWLREARLGNPFKLKSAYSAQGPTGREDLPFTNVTKEFVGCLDYIYFEESQFEQLCKLDVPTSFRDMNSSGISNGHLIPSDIWPSDHVAVGARLRMNQRNGSIGTRKPDAIKASESNGVDSKNATNNNNSNLPPVHDPKCACGCVPNILSLFEMAELRKKMREQKKAEAAALRAANLSN